MLHECTCSAKGYPHFHCNNCDTPLQRKSAALKHNTKGICSKIRRARNVSTQTTGAIANPYTNAVEFKYARALEEIERLNNQLKRKKREKQPQIISIKEKQAGYQNKIISFPAAYATIIFLQETHLTIRKGSLTLAAAQKGTLFITYFNSC